MIMRFATSRNKRPYVLMSGELSVREQWFSSFNSGDVYFQAILKMLLMYPKFILIIVTLWQLHCQCDKVNINSFLLLVESLWEIN